MLPKFAIFSLPTALAVPSNLTTFIKTSGKSNAAEALTLPFPRLVGAAPLFDFAINKTKSAFAWAAPSRP